MRTTINLDEMLYKQASEITGITQKTALLNKALEELIRQKERERAYKNLAKMGGIDPNAKAGPRPRYWEEWEERNRGQRDS